MGKFLSELKRIKRADDIKSFVKKYKSELKKLVLPLMVAAVIAVLWIQGDKPAETEGDLDIEIAETVVETEAEEEESIYIDLEGEVKNPGVYEAETGDRVFQVIEMAGGLTEDADTSSINQAALISDGEKIYIPSHDEAFEGEVSSSGTAQAISSDGKVNINLADATALQEIPGIGSVKAERIVQYRDENGSFSSIEDIKNVSGIGDKTFESIEAYITV